ncbi:MAG: PEP-CTERM sorting domain-containing protein [Proteobacteria bacterium]|nr:PEP-CTERM sorting domain-containing protein [Pseudomonadota bacterium]MBU4298118.1 PEP-CTERM sorting domain-containing protein [Pseudomonadota bacterium]MCG2747926.1 PEP-CTERM sorting domain-containing protein [Desulfobulbaceae bacterium]
MAFDLHKETIAFCLKNDDEIEKMKLRRRNMNRCITGAAFLLFTGMLYSPAQATHIQYVDLADTSNANINYNSTTPDTWTWTFDLTTDTMALWEIDTPTSTTGGPTPDVTTADYLGSYDPLSALHYVTLRIDPKNVSGILTSEFIQLEVNGVEIDDWANPISLYDWGVPGDPVSDEYGIVANDYAITVTLTGLAALGNKTIDITNVNLEGCFDVASPVPEPATMLLFGTGLAGVAGYARKKSKKG